MACDSRPDPVTLPQCVLYAAYDPVSGPSYPFLRCDHTRVPTPYLWTTFFSYGISIQAQVDVIVILN